MLTNVPPMSIGVQEGDRRTVSSGSGHRREGGSGNGVCNARVVGRVLTTQIPTSLPQTSIVSTSTITTTRPITKGIVIGPTGEESSLSNPNLNEHEKDIGKSVSHELSNEERKVALEVEMEK